MTRKPPPVSCPDHLWEGYDHWLLSVRSPRRSATDLTPGRVDPWPDPPDRATLLTFHCRPDGEPPFSGDRAAFDRSQSEARPLWGAALDRVFASLWQTGLCRFYGLELLFDPNDLVDPYVKSTPYVRDYNRGMLGPVDHLGPAFGPTVQWLRCAIEDCLDLPEAVLIVQESLSDGWFRYRALVVARNLVGNPAHDWKGDAYNPPRDFDGQRQLLETAFALWPGRPVVPLDSSDAVRWWALRSALTVSPHHHAFYNYGSLPYVSPYPLRDPFYLTPGRATDFTGRLSGSPPTSIVALGLQLFGPSLVRDPAGGPVWAPAPFIPPNLPRLPGDPPTLHLAALQDRCTMPLLSEFAPELFNANRNYHLSWDVVRRDFHPLAHQLSIYYDLSHLFYDPVAWYGVGSGPPPETDPDQLRRTRFRRQRYLWPVRGSYTSPENLAWLIASLAVHSTLYFVTEVGASGRPVSSLHFAEGSTIPDGACPFHRWRPAGDLDVGLLSEPLIARYVQLQPHRSTLEAFLNIHRKAIEGLWVASTPGGPFTPPGQGGPTPGAPFLLDLLGHGGTGRRGGLKRRWS